MEHEAALCLRSDPRVLRAVTATERVPATAVETADEGRRADR